MELAEVPEAEVLVAEQPVEVVGSVVVRLVEAVVEEELVEVVVAEGQQEAEVEVEFVCLSQKEELLVVEEVGFAAELGLVLELELVEAVADYLSKHQKQNH